MYFEFTGYLKPLPAAGKPERPFWDELRLTSDYFLFTIFYFPIVQRFKGTIFYFLFSIFYFYWDADEAERTDLHGFWILSSRVTPNP